MTTDASKDFMHQFLDASTGKNSAAFMEVMSPDFITHIPGGPKNREGFGQHMNVFNVERLKDGKSLEHWSLFDQFAMIQQPGRLTK